MYASAMKFCGMMELCGIGYPRDQPVDYQWPEVLEQVRAQKAGLMVAVTRSFRPEEADFCRDKGFVALYQFTNPRTGTVGTVWIKDFTGGGELKTKVPESIPWTGRPPALYVENVVHLDSVDAAIDRMANHRLDEPAIFPYTNRVPSASSPDDLPPF